MSDLLERNVFGEVYAEITCAGPGHFQIRFSHWGEPKEMFVTQAMDSDGVACDIVAASEIFISVEGAENAAKLVEALRWLAETLPGYLGIDSKIPTVRPQPWYRHATAKVTRVLRRLIAWRSLCERTAADDRSYDGTSVD